MMPDNSIMFDDMSVSGQRRSFRFSSRIATVAAYRPEDVEGVMLAVDCETAKGRYAAGFVSYEAASAFDAVLPSVPSAEGLPLAWFAIFAERRETALCIPGVPGASGLDLSPRISAGRYREDVADIRARIARGDCYQANYTFDMSGHLSGDPLLLYARIACSQQAPYSAYLDIGSHRILSASPELFFRRAGRVVTTKPMKGTMRRGLHPLQDRDFSGFLGKSPKERAENLMIVDLLRNDLGVIAENGSVEVSSLFDIETYPTVHQMTSTVSATVPDGTGLLDIFRAMFPCGSVTGAPKRKAMEILSLLEGRPRGVYCGAIGMAGPGGDAVFSVAIRTLVQQSDSGAVSLGVGSGITWDSEPDTEYSECLSKSRFAVSGPLATGLVEALRLEDSSYPLLHRHLDRLEWSAVKTGILFDRCRIQDLLEKESSGRSGLFKTRLLLQPDGGVSISSEEIFQSSAPLSVLVSSVMVDPDNPRLFIKSAERSLYDNARRDHPDADEVLLLNTRGEVTEGTYHNLVLKLGARMVTPPLSSGLLPGIMRSLLLEEGRVAEQVIYPSDLLSAEEIWLVNSVRGWRAGILMNHS